MASTAADGSINITIVDGTTITGLHAGDGSVNSVIAPANPNPPNTNPPLGINHGCGAQWVTRAPASTVVGKRAADGSLYVDTTPYTATGAERVTVVSGVLP